MSEAANTPEEIALLARRTISEELEKAKINAIGATAGALALDGQPLAAWELLRQCGVSEGQAGEVLEVLGVAGSALDLLHLPELAELSGRADSSP